MAASQSIATRGLSQLQDSFETLRRRTEDLVETIRKSATDLVPKEQRRSLEKVLDRVRRYQTELRSQAERIYRQLEAQFEKRIEPFVRRLNLPSKHDVEALSKRIAHLEKRLEQLSK